MKIDRTSVTQWLDDHRRGRDWLAEQCGVGLSAVGNWLNMKGSARPIPAEHRITIARLMELDLAREADVPKQNLVLEFEPSEFRQLLEAAAVTGQNVVDWAASELVALAHLDPVETANILAMHSPVIIRHEWPLRHAAAGNPSGSDGDSIDLARTPKPGSFACQLHGDSMSPTYPDGAVVILRERSSLKRPLLKRGEIYLFDLRGELTLKRYGSRPASNKEITEGLSYVSAADGKTKVRILESINPAHPEIVLDPNAEPGWIGWLNPSDQ